MGNEPQGADRAVALTATVERISYRHPESGWTIARVSLEGNSEPTVVVGPLGSLAPGNRVQVEGRWTNHPVHGPQLQVTRHRTLPPDTLEGMVRYLGSGLVKGVGPRLAARIVERFGLETLDVLEHSPGRLAEVPGLGAAKVRVIVEAWQGQRAVRALMLFLQGHDFPTRHASRIYEVYGDDALPRLQRDPFAMLADVGGLPFTTVERLAARLGFPSDAPSRLAACLTHVLVEAERDGHMALPRDELVRRAAAWLDTPLGVVDAALSEVLQTGALVAEGSGSGPPPLIWRPSQRALEVDLADGLAAFLRRPPEVMPDLEDRLARVETAEALPLSSEQRDAVLAAASARVFVLTGGPGTGKTTALRALVRLFEELELVVRLASPTGRAARRLAEVTGREAVTLHRLLGFQPGSGAFVRGPAWPLEADVVLVDEASMLDAGLACALVQAMPPLAQLVLIGDVGQLPPVGPGQVLADLLAHKGVPSRRLSQVFRQAGHSVIVRNAHRISRGELPELIVPTGTVRTDCYFLEAGTPEEALSLVENAVARSLPARFGLDPVQDIQVLTPTNRGPLGAGVLNQRLRQRLLPATDSAASGPDVRLRQGDKVIQLENDPERGVYNGDLGLVEAVDAAARVVHVRTAEGMVEHELDNAVALGLGWAITVHKSQGSEFPAVVVVLASCHGPMLQRRLLYTAMTRARRVVVVVGDRAAVARAVASDDAARRITRLAERLRAAK